MRIRECFLTSATDGDEVSPSPRDHFTAGERALWFKILNFHLYQFSIWWIFKQAHKKRNLFHLKKFQCDQFLMKYKKETTYIFICLHYGESFRQVEELNNFYFHQFPEWWIYNRIQEMCRNSTCISLQGDEYLKKYMIETSLICITFQYREF